MGVTMEKERLETQYNDQINSKPKLKKNNNKKIKLLPIEQTVTQPKIKATEANTRTRNDTNKKKKNEKIVIKAKDKIVNNEKKVLELIHDKNRDKEDYDLIYEILTKHFFMHTLNHQAKEEIIISMSLYRIKEGKTLFNQGEQGNYWYIVHSGELKKCFNNELVGTIQKGESFGERALMEGVPRNNTVIAGTDCQLWGLKRQVFRKILNFIFTNNFKENMQFLEGINMPFSSIDKSIIANNLIQEIYLKGQYICKEGEFGNSIYIIKDGEVECLKNDKIIRILKKGENFGQKALLEGAKRSLDVRAKTDCKIYSISSEVFKNQFGENFKEILYYNFVSQAFMNSETFFDINYKIISKTFPFFKFRSLKNNEIVYPKGTKFTEKLCVVLEGNIVDKAINRVEAKRYQILYEKKIKEEEKGEIKNNLIAEPDCILGEIDYSKFKEILGGDLLKAKIQSNQLNSIDHIPLFRILSDDKIDFLQKHLQIENFENGKKIICQGDIGDKLFIIKSGRVDFFVNSKYIRTLNEGEDFGAKSLILSSDKRTATAIANGEVSCYTLTAEVFKSILEPSLLEYFKYKFYLEDNTIELKDLDNVKELGRGSFGSVNLVRNKKNKLLYAIKALDLQQIKKENLEEFVELEKNILLKIDHPFIMKMVKYLKNERNIFFINEYIEGKELWEVIRDIGLLNKEQTQFYSASILLALNYLHKKKIIYRDLKPENVMVNTKGYIKIIDFGTVKEIDDRTSTIIGTSHYMAPEISRGEGYSFEVDIWSLAICMYEFLCGGLPFGEDLDDPMEIYRAVSNDNLVFPTFVNDEKFMKLMRKMLNKDPTKRLWKFKQIKESTYFEDFDWNKLISLSYPPPYMIEMNKNKDSNENSSNSSNIPYLIYLKREQTVRVAGNQKKSIRQINFEKWLKNF